MLQALIAERDALLAQHLQLQHEHARLQVAPFSAVDHRIHHERLSAHKENIQAYADRLHAETLALQLAE